MKYYSEGKRGSAGNECNTFSFYIKRSNGTMNISNNVDLLGTIQIAAETNI